MYSNGISHLTVTDDLKGVSELLQWLSYVPEYSLGSPLPLLPTGDPVNRVVRLAWALDFSRTFPSCLSVRLDRCHAEC